MGNQKVDSETDVYDAKNATQADLELDNDYQSELIPYSRSAAIASAAETSVSRHKDDGSAEHKDDGSRYRLPRFEFDPTHSREMEHRLREQGEAYSRSRLGHPGKAVAASELTQQADAYSLDADNLENCNTDYGCLVPLANFAVDEVVRFTTIQDALGIEFEDNDVKSVTAKKLDGTVADRRPELQEALHDGDIKTTKGLVSNAASEFTSAQHELMSVLSDLRGNEMHKVVDGLKHEQSEKLEQREAIQRKIDAAEHVFELTNALFAKGDDVLGVRKLGAHEHFEVAEGVMSAGAIESDVAGFVAGQVSWALHDQEFAAIDVELRTITAKISAAEVGEKSSVARALRHRFAAARDRYDATAKAYQNAIASRRTAYAIAGATADKLHAHGHAIKHGDDKASQTMLFISAAREAHIALSSALPKGKDAEETLDQAMTQMAHRERGFAISDWKVVQGEGGKTNDHEQVSAAFRLTSSWIEGTQQEIAAFSGVAREGADMLRKTGKATGDY
jgi:hypothetical protein